MRFYDTSVRRTVDFKPAGKRITIYVCGITPYDSAHLGHIFTFLTYDLLQRRLEDQGHDVTLVRNITDVDEPIFKKAAENCEDYMELARREIISFQKIMRELNFRSPDAEPLASDYIAEMATAVKDLLEGGYAYRLEHDIYFDISRFPTFGSFSGLSKKLQLAFMGDRGGDPKRSDKRHPLDFLLWRGIADPLDPAAWESPVGLGRPGWHIECSVMSSHLLGTPIDIHGGGMDLIFPHHECEIAQSESLGHKPFSNHWLHVAPMLLYGEKMSKSLGNLVFANDLLKDGSPAAIRLALMQYHYRVGGEWCEDIWQKAKQLFKDARNLMDNKETQKSTGLLDAVRVALDNNLDTPAAYRAIEKHIHLNGSTLELRHTFELLGISL